MRLLYRLNFEICHVKSIFIVTQTDTCILFAEVKLQIVVVVLETCYVFFFPKWIRHGLIWHIYNSLFVSVYSINWIILHVYFQHYVISRQLVKLTAIYPIHVLNTGATTVAYKTSDIKQHLGIIIIKLCVHFI